MVISGSRDQAVRGLGQKFTSRRHHWAPVCFAFLGMLIAPAALGAAEALRARLEAMAKAEGFEISGLERLGTETTEAGPESTAKDLPSLLHDYNFALVRPGNGKIERLVISGRKQARSELPLFNHIKTQLIGPHHQVEARLTGPSGIAQAIPLVVDTGASTIVLPQSLAETLGFTSDELQPGVTRTANGEIKVQTGRLRSVSLGTITRKDVTVTFVPDERLGETKLLGMSFLGQFKVTIDDARRELILLSK